MAKGNSSSLLKIVSVIFIIWGALYLLAALGIISVGTVFGAAVGSIGGGAAIGSLLGIGNLVNGIFELIAGITGVNGRRRGLMRFLAVIMLVIGVCMVVGSLRAGDSVIGAVISALLPILYFVGVQQSV